MFSVLAMLIVATPLAAVWLTMQGTIGFVPMAVLALLPKPK